MTLMKNIFYQDLLEEMLHQGLHQIKDGILFGQQELVGE
jgi:hypothetical protein